MSPDHAPTAQDAKFVELAIAYLDAVSNHKAALSDLDVIARSLDVTTKSLEMASNKLSRHTLQSGHDARNIVVNDDTLVRVVRRGTHGAEVTCEPVLNTWSK